MQIDKLFHTQMPRYTKTDSAELKAITLTMVGFEVTVDADLQVFLDREAVALPKTHAGLTIKRAGFFVVLTDSTFSIRFNGAGQFYLDVSGEALFFLIFSNSRFYSLS